MVEDSAELEPVARLGRKLKGRTGSEGGGDISENLKAPRLTKRGSRHDGTLQGDVISRGLA